MFMGFRCRIFPIAAFFVFFAAPTRAWIISTNVLLFHFNFAALELKDMTFGRYFDFNFDLKMNKNLEIAGMSILQITAAAKLRATRGRPSAPGLS